MKTCNRCGKAKDESEYYPKRGTCKACNREVFRQASARYRERNKHTEHYKTIHCESTKQWRQKNWERVEARKRAYRAERVQWLRDYKVTSGCVVCGERHPACLEFHHRNMSEKEVNLGDVAGLWGKQRLLGEIEKCDVLCSNCHKKLHWREPEEGAEDSTLN